MNAMTILRTTDLYSSFLGVSVNCKLCGLTTVTQPGQSLLTFPRKSLLTVNIFCKLSSGWDENMISHNILFLSVLWRALRLFQGG